MTKEKKWLLINGERYEYEEKELEHGKKHLDLDISKENLSLFYSVFEPSGIPYGLFFGTLLGAIREGNFIAHDEDTDIYVFEEDRDEIVKLIPKFGELGLNLVRYSKGIISLMRKNEYIDLYIFKNHRSLIGKRLRKTYYTYAFPAKTIEQRTFVNFLGMQLPIPENPEALLEKIYGSNWRTPIKDYNAPPNTTLGQISSELKKIKLLHNLGKFAKRIVRN